MGPLVGCTQVSPEPIYQAEDRSLTTEQLVRLGLPSPAEAWGVDEYRRAADVLADVASVDPRGLPRHGSPRSGEAFARIVSSENLAMLVDPGLAQGRRVELGGAQHREIHRILRIYLEPAERRMIFDEELARTIGLSLQSSRFLWPLLALVLELPADSEDAAARVEAVDQIRDSFGRVVVAACVALRDFAFRPPARRTLSSQLAALAPELGPAMLPAMKSEVHAVIGDALRSETDPQVRVDLAQVLERL